MKTPRKKETIKAGKYLKFIIRDGWEYIERVNCSGVVIIVSKTDDDKVILVEQFRYPVQSNVIGFPAGLANDKKSHNNESLAACAKRELLEETGFRARRVKKIFEGPVSAGMCKDMVTIFRADGLKKVGEGGGVEDHENITVHEVPLARVDQWLKTQKKRGLLVAPNVFMGIYFLKHWPM